MRGLGALILCLAAAAPAAAMPTVTVTHGQAPPNVLPRVRFHLSGYHSPGRFRVSWAALFPTRPGCRGNGFSKLVSGKTIIVPPLSVGTVFEGFCPGGAYSAQFKSVVNGQAVVVKAFNFTGPPATLGGILIDHTPDPAPPSGTVANETVTVDKLPKGYTSALDVRYTDGPVLPPYPACEHAEFVVPLGDGSATSASALLTNLCPQRDYLVTVQVTDAAGVESDLTPGMGIDTGAQAP